MFGKLLHRLSIRIGLFIVTAQVVVLTFTGSLYVAQFNQQVDQRVQDRVQVPGKLMSTGLLSLTAISDQTQMRNLLGEDLASAYIVAPGNRTLGALNPTGIGKDITTLEDVDAQWFNRTNTQPIFDQRSENGVSYVVSVTPIVSAGSNQANFFLYVRLNTTASEAEKTQNTLLFLVGTLVSVIITSSVIFLIVNFTVVTRIFSTLGAVQKVQAGNLETRIPPGRADEIGSLQTGINAMIAQLRELITTMESRIEQQTRDLAVAADISKRITTVLDMKGLLQQVASLTVSSFDLYYASVFLTDADGQPALRLMASADEHGRNLDMVDPNISFDRQPSLVALAARSRKVVNIGDTAASTAHLPTKELPKTRSELAIPIILGERLIGVFDVQSEQPNAFSEDVIKILQSLSEQVGIAVDNARLYEDAQQARREAERANNVKSAFLASMSHELRTPLNAVLNFSQFLSSGMLGPVNEEQVDLLNKITSSGNHLLHLINDVLDISKIEAGSLRLFIQDDVDVAEEAEEIADTGRTLLEKKPVELKLDIAPNLPKIVADKRRVRQILLNLVSNACKFTETGTVTITVRPVDSQLCLSVRDTGPGIPPEDHEAIFQAFRQTDVGARQGAGTGLGLAISRQLTEAHGGKLWVESVRGSGATFFVTLPMQSPALLKLMKEAGGGN